MLGRRRCIKSSVRIRFYFRNHFSSSTSASTTATPIPEYVSGSHTHFGFSQVPVQEKEAKVREVFESVADSYDLMNDAMSFGIHRVWKDHFVCQTKIDVLAKFARQRRQQQQQPPKAEYNESSDNSIPLPHCHEFEVLDVAGGTGDIGFRLFEAAGCVERARSTGMDPVRITIADINPSMLQVGQRRARTHYGESVITTTLPQQQQQQEHPFSSSPLRFVQTNAQILQEFEDNTFDLYTIAFGLRNVTDVDEALRQAHRVLKPGGRFLCLEFSQPSFLPLRTMYDLYSFYVIPKLGGLLVHDADSYQYLVESIRRFPGPQELEQRLIHAGGFRQTSYELLSGGIVAIHQGYKPIPAEK
jgi:ubiquinone/menaquinone biosynthesis C-methylase UbiE